MIEITLFVSIIAFAVGIVIGITITKEIVNKIYKEFNSNGHNKQQVE